jgi:hypothetical protein
MYMLFNISPTGLPSNYCSLLTGALQGYSKLSRFSPILRYYVSKYDPINTLLTEYSKSRSVTPTGKNIKASDSTEPSRNSNYKPCAKLFYARHNLSS